MIAKIGDQGSFAANLNKFLEEGFIAKIHALQSNTFWNQDTQRCIGAINPWNRI